MWAKADNDGTFDTAAQLAIGTRYVIALLRRTNDAFAPLWGGKCRGRFLRDDRNHRTGLKIDKPIGMLQIIRRKINRETVGVCMPDSCTISGLKVRIIFTRLVSVSKSPPSKISLHKTI